MNNYVLVAAVFIIGVTLFFGINSYIYKAKQEPVALDYKNATYVIEGETVQLVNGVAEKESVPGSASKTITRYFGNEAKKDLNNDGIEEVIGLLTQETGGSGTFYYAVAAISTPDGFVGSEAYFIGDRIAPQTTQIEEDGIVVINYATRREGDSFMAVPSIGKTLRLHLHTDERLFEEIEGTAEEHSHDTPKNPTLTSKRWYWVSTLTNDGTETIPQKKDVFTLTFGNGSQFSATTDCNQISGSYTLNQNQITFGQMASTKMYCEGSQEAVFTQFLQNTSGYLFTPAGELVLELKFDSGTMTFK
jgi:heat shock protein HslJ